MLGKTERYNAKAGDLFVLLAKAQGLFQHIAVVHAGAQYDLRVNLDVAAMMASSTSIPRWALLPIM